MTTATLPGWCERTSCAIETGWPPTRRATACAGSGPSSSTTGDVLLCPPAASAAFPHDHEGERHERTIEVNGKRVPTTDQLFWASLTGMVYLPATVAPISLVPGGLPVGVQIAGPQHGDRTCIAFARWLEQEYQS